MRVRILVLVILALLLSACGHKGNLKSPSQIELDDQKKARQQAKEEQEQQKAQAKAAVQPPQDVPQQDQPYPRTDTGN